MKNHIETIYRDSLMNELKIGDKVVFVQAVCKYPCLSLGKVSGFTPKKVRIGNITVHPDRVVKIISNGQQEGVCVREDKSTQQ